MKRLWSDRSGATSVEYALIAAIVFLGIITSVTALRAPLNEMLESVATAFESILSDA